MKYILMDIEGTTTSISFVHDVLFPFSSKRIPSFIEENSDNNTVKSLLEETKQTILAEEKTVASEQEIIEKLLFWIKTDRKHPALKALQGMIWDEGYKSGELKGHIYPDVPKAFEIWKQQGITLGIYSSGSIEAQKALYKNSIFGDLHTFISNNFDTSSGHKREEKSYSNICQSLNIAPSEILFLSDINEELDAAKKTGLNTIQLVRLTDVPSSGHPQVKNFLEIKI